MEYYGMIYGVFYSAQMYIFVLDLGQTPRLIGFPHEITGPALWYHQDPQDLNRIFRVDDDFWLTLSH